MTTLYIDRKDLELRVRGGVLEFYEPAGRKGSIPFTHLHRVVIRGNVKISTSVIGALTNSGIGILFLSGRHNRHIATCVGKPHNDVIRRFGQLRAYQNTEMRTSWSHDLVIAKVFAQKRLLNRALTYRHDKRHSLFRGVFQLSRLLEKLKLPHEPLSISSIRGMEGAAARIYFASFRSLFAPSLEFSARNKRPPKDPVNSCLSLGYTLLHFEAVVACHSAGLDPLLGMYHEPSYGRESLASDIIEPLRPHVDEWVWKMFRNRKLTANNFSKDNNSVILKKTARQIFYEEFNLLNTSLRRLLRLQALAIAREFESNGSKLSELCMKQDEFK